MIARPGGARAGQKGKYRSVLQAALYCSRPPRVPSFVADSFRGPPQGGQTLGAGRLDSVASIRRHETFRLVQWKSITHA